MGSDLCRQVLPPLEQNHEKTPKQLQRVVVEHRAYRLRSIVARGVATRTRSDPTGEEKEERTERKARSAKE